MFRPASKLLEEKKDVKSAGPVFWSADLFHLAF